MTRSAKGLQIGRHIGGVLPRQPVLRHRRTRNITACPPARAQELHQLLRSPTGQPGDGRCLEGPRPVRIRRLDGNRCTHQQPGAIQVTSGVTRGMALDALRDRVNEITPVLDVPPCLLPVITLGHRAGHPKSQRQAERPRQHPSPPGSPPHESPLLHPLQPRHLNKGSPKPAVGCPTIPACGLRPPRHRHRRSP